MPSGPIPPPPPPIPPPDAPPAESGCEPSCCGLMGDVATDLCEEEPAGSWPELAAPWWWCGPPPGAEPTWSEQQ